MKLSAIFTLALLLVALAFAAVMAADGGPMTGGSLSTNPNGRTPRSDSPVDGGPKSGDSSSVNPNSATTAPPPADEATAPIIPTSTTPATSALDAPMSGGDTSTNPSNRVTTAPPLVLIAAAPSTTPASANSTTEPPSNSAPSSDDHATNTKTPAPAPSQSGESVDFSLIKDDTKSGTSDVVGEVSAGHNTGTTSESASGTYSNTTSTPSPSSTAETANEAALTETKKSGPAAATPSPVSKQKLSSTKSVSGGAPQSGHSSLTGVVTAIVTLTVVLSAVGF